VDGFSDGTNAWQPINKARQDASSSFEAELFSLGDSLIVPIASLEDDLIVCVIGATTPSRLQKEVG